MIRVMWFPAKPEAIVVFADPGEVDLPILTSPFDGASIKAAFREAGIDVRVSEAVAGRWTNALRRAKQDQQSENKQRSQLAEAKAIAEMQASTSQHLRDRAAALHEKQRIDAELARVKKRIGEAMVSARTVGRFMNPARFRELEARRDRLKIQSQGIQAKLGDLRRAEKAANIAASSDHRERFIRNLLGMLKEIMEPDEYEDLVAAAADDSDRDGAEIARGQAS